MNIQELGTLFCEKLPVKILLLNNQHLGMVVQWEDRFMSGRRAHTYLGPVDHPEALGEGDGKMPEETFPNFVRIAEGYGIKARQVRSRAEYPAALAEMLAYDGPYLLDVICPYQEHVLPIRTADFRAGHFGGPFSFGVYCLRRRLAMSSNEKPHLKRLSSDFPAADSWAAVSRLVCMLPTTTTPSEFGRLKT